MIYYFVVAWTSITTSISNIHLHILRIFSEYELRVVDNVTINEEQPGSWKPFHPFNLFDKYLIIYFIEVHPALRNQYKY